MTKVEVVGVDACKGGWVAVTLRSSAFQKCAFFKGFDQLVAASPNAIAIGVDMPIGLPERSPRPADVEAKKLLGKRASSVFSVPARKVLAAPDYSYARRLARELGGPGVSKQAYSLRDKIFEVEAVARIDSRVYEVHPEVSLLAMAKRPLIARKKTWNGLWDRVGLLRGVGIDIPSDIGEVGGISGADDVVDAAAAAWSALRIAKGEAKSLPETPEGSSAGRTAAIWY